MPTLDPLRGLLALGVAVYHLSVWFGLSEAGTRLNMSLAKVGNYSVSAFFVLTGLLLARTAPWPAIAKQGLGRWALKRVVRLAPLFWLAVAVDLALGLGMGPEPKLRFVAENVSLTFGLFHPNHALVTGGWYVGVAVLAYVAWPLVAWVLYRMGRGEGAGLALLAIVLCLWSVEPTLHGVMAQEPWNRFHAYVLPPNQLFLVGLGALAGWAHRATPRRLGTPLFLLGWALALGLLLRTTPWFGDHLTALTGWLRYRYVACVVALVVLAAFHRGFEGPWLKPLARLGGWSYGLYLAHPFLQRAVAPWLGGWTALALSLVGSVLVAALAERWVERPLARWVEGRQAPSSLA